MRFEPYPYQRRAIDWITELRRCALFLDMGLGKTVVTLTAYDRLRDMAEASALLVIAPKTVAETTWMTEAAKWDHLRHLRVSAVIGTAASRAAALAAEADVYVISRDNVAWLMQQRRRPAFDMVAVDELSSFKNPRSQRFKALRALTADTEQATPRVVGLTGTPAPNSLEDLWAQIYVIDRGTRLGRTLTAYRAAYFDAYTLGGIVTKYRARRGADEVIRARLEDICLSMQAADYLTLPPLMEMDVEVPLSEKEMEGYRAFEREQVMAVEDETVTAASAAALLSKLGQYTSGAVYVDTDNVAKGFDRPIISTSSAKIERLAEIVEAAASPCLIFYQYRHEIPRLTDALKPLGTVECYDGPASLEKWNSGKIRALLAHPASTAYGLNMQQGGHTVIWTGTGWNLELYLQANARLHRQGQQQPVRVYRLLCPGTVDHRAASAITIKAQTQASLLAALADIRRQYLRDKK